MRRFTAFLLIVLALIPSVFANGSSETKTEASSGKTVVRLWTNDRHDATFWTKKVEEYNATNTDNIELSYEIYTDNYQQAVDMAFQTGETPDILKYDMYFDKYILDGRFVDIMPSLSDEQKKLTEEVWFEGSNLIDGKLYFIPTGNTCLRLFYNKTIFDRLGLEVPTTVEEMVNAALTITKELSKEGIYGFACNLKSASNGLKRSLEPEVERGTGLRLGYDFGTGTYDFTPYIPYLKAWAEMIQNGFPGSESLDIDPLRSQFAAGKIGMYMSYTHAEPGVYVNQFPMAEGQEWGCTYLPIEEGEHHGQYFTGTPGFLFTQSSKNYDAAWKAYSDVFLNVDNLREHFEQGFGISSLTAVIESAEMGEAYQNNPALLKADDDIMYPKTPEEEYAQDFIVEGLDMYNTFGAIIAGQLDVESAIADLTKRYNSVNERLISQGVYERVINENFAR